MKNKLASIVLVTVLICTGLTMLTEAGDSTATAPKEEWNVTFGGRSFEYASSVQQTSDGGYIIVGSKQQIYGDVDVWLIKTDSNGQKQWDKIFEGDISFEMDGDDEGSSVQQTSDGGYIITGYTQSYGAGSYDAWLIKTDSNGGEQWNKTFGGAELDRGYSGQQTSDGGYVIVGVTESYGAGSSDVWLIKTDSDGNMQWDKTFGGGGEDVGNSVQQTSDGGYIIIGTKDPHGAPYDVWLIKTNSKGKKQWDTTFGGDELDCGYSGQQTSDGGYVIVGVTESYGAGDMNLWLIKTNSKGKKQWDTTFGGDELNWGKSVQQTSDGGYIIVGGKQQSDRDVDIWLIKTDSDGNEQWNETFGGDAVDEGFSVQQTSDGGYILMSIVDGVRSMMDTNYNVSLIKLEGTNMDISPKVTAPDIEKPPEKSIPGFGALGAMFGVFVVFLLIRRRA
jgi:PGF-CTERM protein